VLGTVLSPNLLAACEDIFLAYEMVTNGLDIGFSEAFFYGKGRDVEFNAASVFLKKLAQGCVMQLASRQVSLWAGTGVGVES